MVSILAEKPADANEHPTQNFGTPGIKPLERPSAGHAGFHGSRSPSSSGSI